MGSLTSYGLFVGQEFVRDPLDGTRVPLAEPGHRGGGVGLSPAPADLTLARRESPTNRARAAG